MPFSTRTMRPADWKQLRYFAAHEFKAPDKMGYEFMLWLEKVRAEADVPMIVSSSYRDKAYNARVGGATDSAHTDVPCNAVDIREAPRPDDPSWNYSRFRIMTAAWKNGCIRVGTYADGSLHFDRTEDTRPAPRIWRVVR